MAKQPEQAPLSEENRQFQAIDREHQREMAIVNARPLLQRVLFGAAVVIDVALLIFFALTIIAYLVYGSFVELRAAATLGDNGSAMHAIVDSTKAKDLIIGSPKSFSTTDGHRDLVVDVENPNDEWYATFTYTFSWSGGSEKKEGFIMPGEKKYLLALNVESTSLNSGLNLEMSDFSWHFIDRHVIPDPKHWLDEMDAIDVINPTYAGDLALGEAKIGRSTFTLKNNTGSSFWSPTFTVLLMRNGVLDGVHQATVPQFTHGESRDVEVRWYGNVPASGQIMVVPNINFFDPASYVAPQGGQASDVRDLFADD